MSTDTEITMEEIDKALESLDIEYSAEFVPWNQSRNKDEDTPSLNWKVTLKRGGVELTTDYMQGIGHLDEKAVDAQAGVTPLPNQDRRRLPEILSAEIVIAIEGKQPTPKRQPSTVFLHKMKPVPAPLLRDVMSCLLLDYSVLDAGGFEDWADELGYDTDSRKAEAIYRACIEIALKIRAMFADSVHELSNLQELFMDY